MYDEDQEAAAYEHAFARDQKESYLWSLSNEAEALAHMGYAEDDEPLPFSEPTEQDEY